MATLNRGAGEAMIEVGAHACTDITGFGLIGHAIELGAGARRHGAPRGCRRAVDGGAGALRRQAFHVRRPAPQPRVRRGPRPLVGRHRGAAPRHQSTRRRSGGLLIAVAPEKLADLLAALEQRGVETRAVVGEVVARDGDVDVEVV